MYDNYKYAMNNIVPKLDQREREQLSDALSRYTKLLMDAQEFISYTSTGVRYAKSLLQLSEAVPVKQLQKLIEDVQNLLKEYSNMECIVKAKLQEDKSIGYLKKITTGVFALGMAFSLIDAGVGALVGLSSVESKNMAKIGLVPAVVGGAAFAMARCAKETFDMGIILQTLEEMKNCLIDISTKRFDLKGTNNYNKRELRQHSTEEEDRNFKDTRNEFQDILGKTQKPVSFDNQKKECERILDKIQKEVHSGFDILKM